MTMVPVSLLVRKDAIDSENLACKMPAFKRNWKEWSHFKVEYVSGLAAVKCRRQMAQKIKEYIR